MERQAEKTPLMSKNEIKLFVGGFPPITKESKFL